MRNSRLKWISQKKSFDESRKRRSSQNKWKRSINKKRNERSKNTWPGEQIRNKKIEISKENFLKLRRSKWRMKKMSKNLKMIKVILLCCDKNKENWKRKTWRKHRRWFRDCNGLKSKKSWKSQILTRCKIWKSNSKENMHKP